jgi:hypothetical protein
MTKKAENPSSHAQAALLLELSHDRRRQAEQLARHEFRLLMNDLQSGDFIYAPDSDFAAYSPPPLEFNNDHALCKAIYSGLPVLNVPVGSIAFSANLTQLPCIGIQIIGDEPGEIKRSLINLLSEHHHSPFCRPIFLCRRLDLLPFFRRFGFAVYYQKARWVHEDYELLQLRYGLTQIRSVVSGAVLW